MKFKQAGFSLIEVFISLSVGLALLLGVMATFVSISTTTSETSSYGEIQENGRFALSLLTDDLLRQDYWGDLSGNLNFSTLVKIPALIPSDCVGAGLNNRSFPINVGHFRTLWGKTLTAKNNLGCITKGKIGTDLIQIKRAVSSEITPGQIDDKRYYLISNLSHGEIFSGADPVPNMDFGKIWEYQHHIYYIQEYTQGDNIVPTLVLGRLRSTVTPPIDFEPLVDGIETIRFNYGVDTDGDGIVNVYLSADDMTDDYWDNANNSRILAVNVYVLARDIMPDRKYENNNTYQLGDITINGNGDNYRRLLFSSTVTLFNAGMDSW